MPDFLFQRGIICWKDKKYCNYFKEAGIFCQVFFIGRVLRAGNSGLAGKGIRDEWFG